MKGLAVKEILKRNGFSVSGVAEKLGESNQNLFAALAKDDVKSGLLERIAEATGLPIAVFYGDSSMGNGSGNQASIVAGNNNNINTQQDAFLRELAAQRKLTEKSQEQTEKSQEQIDRLLGIIEKLSE